MRQLLKNRKYWADVKKNGESHDRAESRCKVAVEDRWLGWLLAMLSAAVEFPAPGSFVPVTGYRDGGPHNLKPGEWTDDTSMALALADSIAMAGWDLEDQTNRYVEWWQTGKYSVNGRCFDIGITTRSALSQFAHRPAPETSEQ